MKKFKTPGAWLIDIEGVLVKDKSYRPVAGSVAWMQDIQRSGVPWLWAPRPRLHDQPDQAY